MTKSTITSVKVRSFQGLILNLIGQFFVSEKSNGEKFWFGRQKGGFYGQAGRVGKENKVRAKWFFDFAATVRNAGGENSVKDQRYNSIIDIAIAREKQWLGIKIVLKIVESRSSGDIRADEGSSE